MKVFIVLCLAIASTCALNLRGSKFEPDARISNGLEAEDHQLPYQAALLLRLTAVDSWWCSGALIAKNWVLTTASCAEGARDALVYLGEKTRELGTMFISREIIIHPQWNTDEMENDISLVRIPDVTLSKRINLVPLPAISETYSNYINEPAIVSGWGENEYDGLYSQKLQYAILPIVDNSVCSKVYGSSVIKPSTICLSTPDETSPCSGDSGDPLVLAKTGILVGLFSYGYDEDCRKGDPVGFTRVTSYRTWIKDITGV